MLQRLEVLDRLAGTEDMVLGGTILYRFCSLGLRAGKNDNLAAQCDSKLDSNVTEATNAHNSDAIGRANTKLSQDSPDSRTSTHERGGID